MLQEILSLFKANHGQSLTPAAIASRLDIAPDMVEQLLRTLQNTRRLIQVEDCAECAPCPLQKYCPKGIRLPDRAYRLPIP